MASSNRKLFYLFNWPLFVLILLLLAVGLINLYSATSTATGEMSNNFRSQLLWVGFGILLLGVSLGFHFRCLLEWAPHFYVLSLILLLLVLFLGKSFGGQQNWLVLGWFRIQPSELAKLALVMMLARHFSRNNLNGPEFGKTLWGALGLIALPTALVLAEKDVGAALFFVLIGLSFFFFAGIKRGWLLGGVLLLFLAGVGGYHFFLSDYQKTRIEIFSHPEKDPRGSGYQLLQSKIAVGSGQLTGKGYLQGKLNKLNFIPERHTDFAFPVLAEEWGYLGSGIVVLGFGVFLFLLLHAAGKVEDAFGAYFVAGVAAWLFWQTVLNLSGVLGLLPLAGVTLPFFSYGGSALVTTLLALGLVLNVHMRRYVF